MRLGDSLTEDFICSQWMSLWHISGNHKYFTLVLNHLTHMQELNPLTYMRIQTNRHVWLHGGKIGSWLARLNCIPVDEMIEFDNVWVQKLPFVKSLMAFILATAYILVM